MNCTILVEGAPYDGKEVLIDTDLIHDGFINLLRPKQYFGLLSNRAGVPRQEKISDEYQIEKRLSQENSREFYVLVCLTAGDLIGKH